MLKISLSLILISCILQSNGDQPTPNDDDDLKFYSGNIIPDIIDVAPGSLLNMNYGEITVKPRNRLTPTQVRNIPSISFPSDPNKFYTLVFVDPDVQIRSFKHWLVVNIPGDDLSRGDTIAGYIGAAPPEGSRYHRYVFLVYEQPQRLKIEEKDSNRTVRYRQVFSVRDFASQHGLGDPVAGNYFLAMYDSYVPKLYAQLIL